MSIRMVVQRCDEASMCIYTDAPEDGAWEGIGRGMVVLLSFLRGSEPISPAKLTKAVTAVANAQLLLHKESGKPCSVLDTAGDVLVVPQACLAGKLKGKRAQYHAQYNKGEARDLFHTFVSELRTAVEAAGGRLMHGTYGHTQMLKVDATHGPYTHLLEM